jgi:hypothetical protein
MCYVDWNVCYRNLSRQIWSTMWIRADDRGWFYGLIWGALWIGANSEIMMSWPDLKYYVDCKECEKKLSRPIWITLWVRTHVIAWCLDLTWDSLTIGTYVNKLCHDVIWSGMWIGKDVTWSFLDQFEVICWLEQIIENDVMT